MFLFFVEPPVSNDHILVGRTRGGALHGEQMDCCREKAKAGLQPGIVCPNVTRRTNERIVQNERARAGLLADWAPHHAFAGRRGATRSSKYL